MTEAYEAAQLYAYVSHFSFGGLVDQLVEYDGFTREAARAAAEQCGDIWAENALSQANLYLSIVPFSYQRLSEQLGYDQFTASEISYAVENCGADWYEQAAKQAKAYADSAYPYSFSRAELIEQLEFEGYTSEQAVYGADAAGIN